MASSSDQASLFKDKYIKNILGNNEVPQNIELPESDLGEVASIIEDVGTGTKTMINDNQPNHYVVDTDMNRQRKNHSDSAANPVENQINIPFFGEHRYGTAPQGTAEQIPISLESRKEEHDWLLDLARRNPEAVTPVTPYVQEMIKQGNYKP